MRETWVSFVRIGGCPMLRRRADIVLNNICVHTIAETLLGSFPDYRHTSLDDDTPITDQDIQDHLENMLKSATFNAHMEMGYCERLMVEGKPYRRT